MKKLGRFTVVAFAFIVLFTLMYCIIPALVAIFGGSFLAVAQHPMHVVFIGTITSVVLGVVFNDTFDTNFYPKD
jgi:hypothetical protein